MSAASLAARPVRARRRLLLMSGLLLSLLVLPLVMLASLGLGTADISPGQAWNALVAFDGSREELIIRELRVPRTLIAAAVGASLAVAGALMQGLTRNPLASPSLLGINAGAAMAVVFAVFVFKAGSTSLFAWFAFAGAAAAAALVYLLGATSRGGATPIKLTVVGAALTALLTSLTTGLLVISERTLDEIRFWLAGSVAERDVSLFVVVAPYLAVGLVMAFLLARQVTILSLGEDVARGLGQRTAHIKALAAGCVVVLAGGSVAVAGPISFVGLVVPHLVRFFVGGNYAWVLPYSAVIGAILLVVADVVARLVIRPQELPVGVMTALIGGPFFIYLAWWKVRR